MNNGAEYERMVAAAMAGSSAAARQPVPRRGQNREFDKYLDDWLGGEVPEGDIDEMRRAAWATWRTEAPPTASTSGSRVEEDDDLARALALSREEISRPPTRQPSVEEDDELQRAIAMSEEEARAPKRQKREETPEEERRMLEEALAASLATEAPSEQPRTNGLRREESDELIQKANEEYQAKRAADRAAQQRARLAKIEEGGGSSQRTASNTSAVTVAIPDPTPPARLPGTVNSLLADRAKMEQERLARQMARQGGQSGAASPSPSIASSATLPVGRHGGAGPARAGVRHPYQAQGPFPTDAAGEYYLDAELRHSALTIGGPATERTFSATDIIGQKSQISLLLLNSFVIDDAWLSTILPDPVSVPQIIIRPHPRDQPTWNGKVQAQPSGEVWIYPRMVGEFGSQHMKYLWIFYKTGRLRVVISTANFVSYDWDFIENTIFIQDFLPLPSPQPLRPTHKPHDFPIQFRTLFKHLKVHKALDFLINNHARGKQTPFRADPEYGDMQKYDWSRVTVRLVMSVPGTYEGWEEMDRFGMCRIGRVVRDEGWRPKQGEKAVVEFQGSSLGQYGLDWFSQFHQLCSGKTAQQQANQPKPKGWAPIKIIFPSLATVDASDLKRQGGGTMFVGKAWNSVMKSHFHDSKSKRGGVLMHAKLLVTTFEPQEEPLGFAPSGNGSANGKRKAEEMEDADEAGGWIYVGSHNFSSAAWGTINVKKSPPTLNIRNYELGVLFPLREPFFHIERTWKTDVLARQDARKVADRIVPYRRPARPYGPNDVPWTAQQILAALSDLAASSERSPVKNLPGTVYTYEQDIREIMFDFAQSMVGTGLGQPDDSGSLPYMTPGTQSCDSFLIPPLYYSSSSSTPDGSPASASLVTPPISDRLVRETPGDRSIQIEGVTGGTKRIRRFHRRSKNGCEHCKKRRVRCDEAKPVCGNCVKKGSKDLCVYSWDESRRSESKDSHSPTLNNRDTISTGTSGNSSTATAPYPAIDPLFPQPQASSSYQFETKTPCSVPFTDSLAFPTSGSSSIVEPIPPFNPSQPTFPPFAGSAPTTTRPDLLTPLQTRPPDGIEEISRVPGTFDDDPASTLFSPTTENMLNLLFGVPQTPPLPHLNWPEEGDSSHLSVQSCDKNGQQHQQVDCSGWCTTSEGIVAKVTNNQIALKNQRSGVNQDAFAAELYRRNAILNALIRQASILQQPNELATYFPSIEQRSQFCHFLYETANDLIVVPVAHAVNPWVTHLTHLALGRAAGHEVLHDAFRYGLLSLSSFDMGLRIRRGIRTPGYNAMYATSMEQRDTAIRLLQVAKSLKLYVWDVTGADLLLATVTALAIRDRLAGEQDFQNPLNLGISVITEQGGPAAFIAKSDTAVRRFLVEQMACLEILGILTTWDPPRLLVGDMKWFDDSNAFSSDDHLISVYGWNRQTIMLTAEIMTMTDEIKEVVTMRTTYRETSYPAIKSALDGRLAHLEAQYATLSRKAEEIRRKNLDTPLHPRVALGTCIQHACMDLLLVGPPDDDSLLPVAEAKARIILDLCEKSMSQGMYTGMLFPLTWAASCLNSPDQVRLQGLLRALKPHYHVDPALMDNLVEMDWSEMNMDCDKWEQVMRDKGWFAPLF